MPVIPSAMYEFPIEVIKYQYVLPVGGFSAEVQPNAIGINKFALEEKGGMSAGK